jgi:hypothetical protein
VAAVTALQRTTAGSAAAAAAAGAGAARAAPAQQQQQCDRVQAEWLLPQALRVLCGYARWLPEAVADGHVDLGKLLLQGQGQVRICVNMAHLCAGVFVVCVRAWRACLGGGVGGGVARCGGRSSGRWVAAPARTGPGERTCHMACFCVLGGEGEGC